MKLNKITATLFALGMVSPAWADFTINSIHIEGEQHTSEATVRTLLPVKEGETFTNQLGEDIIRSLYASGFYENISLEQNGNMLIITVQERPIISSFTVEGAKVISGDAITQQIANMRTHANKRNDTDLISSETGNSYDEKLAALEKNAEQQTTQALASAGLSHGEFLNTSILQQAIDGLRQAYAQYGKNQVKITPEITPLSQNRVAIKLKIEEGETTRVKKIEFEGNEHFTDQRLIRQIGLTEGTLLSWFTKSDVFAWNKFNEDKEKLESFYHRHGFFDFKVDAEEVERKMNDAHTQETIVIQVHEGKRYRWGNFSVAGDFKEVPQEKLSQYFKPLKTGKISNYDQLQQVMQEILNEMKSAGYANATVESSVQRHISPNDEEGVIDVTVMVNAGQRVAVREINISGNNKTRDEVIRREFRQMEDAVYDQSKIQRSVQRLNQLSYFTDVETQQVPIADNPQQVDLNVKVTERPTGSINATAGWLQGDGLVLSAGIAQDNLFGTGKSTNISVSRNKIRKNASLSFTDPYFTPDGISMSYSLFGSDYNPYKQNASPRNYRLTKYGGSATMGIPIGEHDRINVGLGVEHLNVKLFPNSPLRYKRYVERNGAKNWIYKGTLSWYRNTTDDAYWPTKGYETSLTGDVGLPKSGLQYYELGHQQTWYFPLNHYLTLMLNGQIGYSGSYGKTKQVPFMYTQSGGGLGSVRGYESGSLGPKAYDTTGGSTELEALGGKFSSNVNAELLFPFPGLKDDSKSVRLSLFADAGSVWDNKTYNPYTYDEKRNPNGTDGFYKTTHKSSFKNELRYSAGAALTWISPIGPIKLSYAYPLKKKNTDQVRRFQFQLGTVF